MSVKKKLLQNGIASSIQKGIKILDQLLLVPFFITSWGAGYYGEWLTLTIIPTMLGFSDLGFGTAAANAFILKYAANDKQGAANIAASGFRAITIMILISLLVSVVLIFTLNYLQVFDKSLIDSKQAIWAISLLMAARVFSFYQQLFEAYFRAERRAALSINLRTGYAALNLIACLAVLLMGGGIILFAFATFSITIVFNIVYAIIAVKILPIHKDFKGQVLKEDIKLIVSKGFGYLLSPVWQAVFFQGTTFVVRIVLGPVAVAIFNTVRTVSRVVNQGYSIIISAILPELQFEIGANNMQKARKIFRVALFMVIAIALGGMVFLYFGGSWFYELWTRKALNPPTMMWNVFIIGILFNAVWWMSSFVFQAMNEPYEFAVAGVVAATLSVICSYFLTRTFGLTGAAFGSLVMDVLLFLYIFPKSCKLMKQPIKNLWRDSMEDLQDIWNKQRIPSITKKRSKE